MTKKKKYFPNNWRAFKEQPDRFFLPIEYEEFVQWKINGWMLPSSVACIIREEDPATGRISEKVYSRPQAAQKYLTEQMDKDAKVFTICDDEAVHILMPKYMIDEQQLEEDYDED